MIEEEAPLFVAVTSPPVADVPPFPPMESVKVVFFFTSDPPVVTEPALPPVPPMDWAKSPTASEPWV